MIASTARPFLKWAGGKTQLIEDIRRNIPRSLVNDSFTFVEPFVGSGAVFFWMLGNFPRMKKAVINDVNADLITCYRSISSNPKEIVRYLKLIQREFHALDAEEEKKKSYYYEKRELFNSRNFESLLQAALFIFLNRTCFNGLFRVNSKNEYNVPMGSYRKPTICDEQNIWEVHRALERVEILTGDFEILAA